MQQTDFLAHTIEALRSQMRALDHSLAMLQGYLRTEKVPDQHTGSAEPACPKCGTIFTHENDATTMGSAHTIYVCPKCNYQGESL